MTEYPVVVVGAGPIGLAAAAHLTETGSEVVVNAVRLMREAAGPMAGMNIPGMPKLF